MSYQKQRQSSGQICPCSSDPLSRLLRTDRSSAFLVMRYRIPAPGVTQASRSRHLSSRPLLSPDVCANESTARERAANLYHPRPSSDEPQHHLYQPPALVVSDPPGPHPVPAPM